MEKNTKEKELNILICGSQRFDDQAFVYGMLDKFYAELPVISNIITSRFSGACSFAKTWVEKINGDLGTNIGVIDFSFDMELEKKNISLYEQADIPDFILREDPFFQKGKDKLIESGVQFILAFPNNEGIIGTSTLNIKRFAMLADIGTLDCSHALTHITQCRHEESGLYVPDKSVVIQQKQDTLGNRHPSRKF